MALARLALRNLNQRVSVFVSSSLIGGVLQKQNKWCNNELVARFASAMADDKGKSEDQVAISLDSKTSPRLRGMRRWNEKIVVSKNDDRPFDLWNAFRKAIKIINKLAPWSLDGHVKESDDHYKWEYDMPGIPKEEVKITIGGDGVLIIKGEHKEKKRGIDDDEYWSSSSHGYYCNSMVLPVDAKVDERQR